MKILTGLNFQPPSEWVHLKTITDEDGASIRILWHDDNLVLMHEPSSVMLQLSRTECFTFGGVVLGHKVMLDLMEQNTAARKPVSQDDMVFIKGGTFEMGDQFGEGRSNEKPAHSVTLSDYYMGKYEVTFDEYDLYCTETGREKPNDEEWGRGRRPVINVDWYNAVEYCNWRSQKENLSAVYTIDKHRKDSSNKNDYDNKKWTVTANYDAKGYRLPTEAEWEYAARAVASPSGGGRGEVKSGLEMGRILPTLRRLTLMGT